MGTCSRGLCLILSLYVDFHNCVFSIQMKTRANGDYLCENPRSLSCLVAEISGFKFFQLA